MQKKRKTGSSIDAQETSGFRHFMPEASDDACEQRRKGRVLILDNDPVVRDVVTDMLRSIGYAAYAAETEEEAVECYHRARSCGYPFQTVLMDLTTPRSRQPEEMETAGPFPAGDQHVKTIAMSGVDAERTVRECGRRGIRVALWKPFTLDELARAMAPWSGRPGTGSMSSAARREEHA